MFLRNLKERIKVKMRKQTCFVYCPKCRNELISSGSWVEDNDGIVKYKCTKCGCVSEWDFIHYPVPLLLIEKFDYFDGKFDRIKDILCLDNKQRFLFDVAALFCADMDGDIIHCGGRHYYINSKAGIFEQIQPGEVERGN